MDLSSMVMLKDNHIWSQGSITQAVTTAKDMAGFSVKIDVECNSEAQAREAIGASTGHKRCECYSTTRKPAPRLPISPCSQVHLHTPC